MNTVTIDKKEYRALRAAKERLEALLNKRKPRVREKHTSLNDLVGVLSDVEAFKGKSSVEVQHMIPDLWTRKRS